MRQSENQYDDLLTDSKFFETANVYRGLSAFEISEALSERERQAVDVILERERGAGHIGALESPLNDSDLRANISEEAHSFIVEAETGGQAYYERVIRKRPHWPGGQSGVTVGCGYDLGYHALQEFKSSWNAFMASRHVELLSGGIGKKGRSAQRFMPRVTHILIEWGEALAVFDSVTLLKYTRLMTSHLPSAIELHPHSFGALVSLVFNRGASFKLNGDRYREMREIRRLIEARQFDGIPDQIRSMKRLWANQNLRGLLIRRDKEAELFQSGLDAMKIASQDAQTRERLTASTPAVAGDVEGVVAEATAEQELEWLEGLTPDQLDQLLHEEERDTADSVEPFDRSLESFARRYTKADVRWVLNDRNHPDYSHLPPDAAGQSFAFKADGLDRLIALSRFQPDFGSHNKIIFALRGAKLDGGSHSQEGAAELRLIDVRPDHVNFKCVIGIYDQATRLLSAYTASTVCNAGAVVACYNYYNGFSSRKQGNILPTGCYEMCVGTHYGSVTVPGVFRLGNGPGPASASTATVLRSGNDVTYGTQDIWDPCIPSDNLHPAFDTARFSSLGCLTVRGTYRGGGRHEGEWAMFRQAAGLNSGIDQGTRYDMALFTGLDAVTLVHFRSRDGVNDTALAEILDCLRQGSRGPEVEKLQTKLGVTSDGVLGPGTVKALADLQMTKLGWASGTYSREMDVHLGFEIFGSAIVTV